MSTSWHLVPLAEVLTERQEVPSPDALASGKIRIVAKIAFDNGQIQLRSEPETRTGMILIRPGDLVISGINAAKGAIAVYGAENTEPIAATIHYGAYIPKKEKVDAGYLWWLLRSGTFRELLLKYVPGGIKTELKAKRLLPVPIPLPSFSEQQRIVARIEELAAKIKEAQGLQQDAAEEATALVSKGTSRLVDEAGWTIRPLGELLMEPPRNGLCPKPELEHGGRPMLRINAVSSSPTRFVDLTAKKMVEVSSDEAAPFELRHDDVFIVRYNGDIDRVAKPGIYKGSDPCHSVYPDKLMRLRPDRSKMLPDFLVFALGSRSVREQIEELGKTTAGNIGISGGNAKSFRVPVPPLTEQHRIVGELDALQSRVDALKKLQAATIAELDAMLPSILDKAFKGEL